MIQARSVQSPDVIVGTFVLIDSINTRLLDCPGGIQV